MPTLNQLLSKQKTRIVVRKKGTRSKALKFRPQRKGVCFKVLTMKPKKPNSAQRKIVKVHLMYPRRKVTCYVPGMGGFDLKNYSQVLVRGGHVCDLPGVQYHLIRGKLDLTWREDVIRRSARSKYSIPRDITQKFFK